MMNRLASAALAATLAVAVCGPLPAAAQMKPMKEPSASQLAARERMTKCSAEWKAAKAGRKIDTGMTWPKYWSACNARMKGGMKA